MSRESKFPGKNEPETTPQQTSQEQKMADFVEVNGSPVPGLTLRHVLRGHRSTINRIAWSPDGKYLATPSNDTTIRIWDMNAGECAHILEGHGASVTSVAWSHSPMDQKLVSACNDDIRIWDIENRKTLNVFKGQNLDSATWTADGSQVIVREESLVIHYWDTLSKSPSSSITINPYKTHGMAWSPDQKLLALGDYKGIDLVNEATKAISRLDAPNIRTVSNVAWASSGRLLAASGWFDTIAVWDTKTLHLARYLEGHTSPVRSISFSKDDRLFASKSEDSTVRIWQTKSWMTLAILPETVGASLFSGIAFHPHLPILATLGEEDRSVRIWELDEAVLLGQANENINYTTAKLVLVGDSSVGKTSLGWRLAHSEFKEHASSHGQQFWSIPQLSFKRKDGTDCEAVLWDLAGQHVYRQVHSIFLENVAAALVLFDPTNRLEPLKGTQFWLGHLKGKGQLPPTVLVGTRVDRGAPALSQTDLEQFCQRYGIKGGYISTSAKEGTGLEELLETVKRQIPWDEMTATVTTTTFKRIKDYVLSLKEKTEWRGVLVSPTELETLLKETSKISKASDVWEFTNAEMMTAVGHLGTHGYVTVLLNSAGEQTILLTPELLVNLAASIILLADRNPHELGTLSEKDLLQGKYPFDELKGLEPHEEQILLDAAILRFLEHDICFRDTFNDDTLLIFPSLIKQKRPLQDDTPSIDDVSYVVRGRIENLYPSLVVLLGYTPSFSRINQWQNQAQYEMEAGQICGFRSIEEHEGELELVLYYSDQIPPKGREQFEQLFEQFLYQHDRDVEVTRFPPVMCKNRHLQKRSTVIERVRDKKPFMFCDECGDKVLLPNFDQLQTIGIGASPWLQREEGMARLRSSYEKHLTHIKRYRRNWATPHAYLSYLPEQKELADKLTHDLRDAGVLIVEQALQIELNDFVIVLNSSAYQKAFQSSSPILANDSRIIRERLGNSNKNVLSLGCDGKMSRHEISDCKPGDFCEGSHYCVSLFNLVMNLYALPFSHKLFAPWRKSLHEQWEGMPTLRDEPNREALKIFISYSHKDETFKEELVTMLEGLQRRGVVDAWEDRQINVGEKWNQSIQAVIAECDLALLLVSPDYLASSFIQGQEQPKILQRHEEMTTRVIPIIVRPCTWQSEPALARIQAFPRDNKAIVAFSKDNGDRDQIWTTIAQEIEKRAKEKSR